ncbi:MAG: hypothetical protein SCARUB_04575, partial [Candidatus Scalindua rubra]
PIRAVETKLKIVASIISAIAIGYIYLTYRSYKKENKHNISESEGQSKSV